MDLTGKNFDAAGRHLLGAITCGALISGMGSLATLTGAGEGWYLVGLLVWLLIANAAAFLGQRIVRRVGVIWDIEVQRQRQRPPSGPLLALGAEDLLKALDTHSDLIRLSLAGDPLAPGDTIEEWAAARNISYKGLFEAGDFIADMWIEDIGVELEGEALNAYRASYAMCLAVGMELERDRRDRMELPQ